MITGTTTGAGDGMVDVGGMVYDLSSTAHDVGSLIGLLALTAVLVLGVMWLLSDRAAGLTAPTSGKTTPDEQEPHDLVAFVRECQRASDSESQGHAA